LNIKALFMQEKNEHLDALHDIRNMMERSSRFISLSGLSGIGAGICALAAACYIGWRFSAHNLDSGEDPYNLYARFTSTLLYVGIITFVAALLVAFLFTYLRSRKTGVPIWGTTARRLLINTAIPLVTGGIVVLRLLEGQLFELIAPMCLVFYGLALINGSKYTLKEIRWLGFSEILLGLVNLWFIGYGLYFWGAGFGLLHILYGAIMWWKYEKA
jgi:hypothetical protein